MATALDNYCCKGHEAVEGWLLQGAIDCIRELSVLQQGLGIAGPVCEIGVHHGRLFVLLHLLSGIDERSLAIDLFEMQDENIDQSGKGSRERLLRNLQVHGCDLARIDLLAENSLRLTPERIVAACAGRPRLFSIDGGHTAEATRNDLALAERSICDGGLVILDDYFNAPWPGVSEGTCAYMHEAGSRLLPVAITSNKFCFTNDEAAASSYRRHLIEHHHDAKSSTVFGHDVVCFEAPPPPTLRQKVTAHPLWLAVRPTPVGQALLKLKR
jgi:hypothetical protein